MLSLGCCNHITNVNIEITTAPLSSLAKEFFNRILGEDGRKDVLKFISVEQDLREHYLRWWQETHYLCVCVVNFFCLPRTPLNIQVETTLQIVAERLKLSQSFDHFPLVIVVKTRRQIFRIHTHHFKPLSYKFNPFSSDVTYIQLRLKRRHRGNGFIVEYLAN